MSILCPRSPGNGNVFIALSFLLFGNVAPAAGYVLVKPSTSMEPQPFFGNVNLQKLTFGRTLKREISRF
jgi:hypothetical protein